jgi:hypothetical protein
MTRTVLALVFALTATTISVNGQSLFVGPESIAYDAANDRYLVSNYTNGNIIAVDHDKNTSIWYSGLVHGFGCEIVGDRFYVSIDGDRVVGINLTSKAIEWQITSPTAWNLDGITCDGGNYLYIVDTYGQVLKADITNQTYESFATGLGTGIQDIAYDGARNRLLVAAYLGSNSVLAVDLTTRAVTVAMEYPPATLDGICMGYDGNFFLSSHSSGGRVVMWNGEYSSPGMTLIGSLSEPAGSCYNFVEGEFAVTRFSSAALAYVNFGDPEDDGIPWLWDNCPEVYNPDQIDEDRDGLGDACDPCTDTDSDGFGDPGYPANTCPVDNCPGLSNPHQNDQDNDGVGDVCDNCWLVPNVDQLDSDGDCPTPPYGLDPKCGDACLGCCLGRVGDANGEGEYPDEVTLGDIMLLVDVKFISGDCSKLPCVTEADVNQDGGDTPICEEHVTLGDIMTLVDFLFITGPEIATLPDCL